MEKFLKDFCEKNEGYRINNNDFIIDKNVYFEIPLSEILEIKQNPYYNDHFEIITPGMIINFGSGRFEISVLGKIKNNIENEEEIEFDNCTQCDCEIDKGKEFQMCDLCIEEAIKDEEAVIETRQSLLYQF